jgi:peptidoglycan DL-endopeptidase CwlO
MVGRLLWVLVVFGVMAGQAEEPVKEGHGRPAMLVAGDLAGFDALAEDRRKLIEVALKVGNESPWLPYQDGGADPAAGGFDCSGAMHFVMREAGLEPPRSSTGQLEWLKAAGRLKVVAADAADLEHPSLADLKPGDLVFWEKAAADGKGMRIHHVAMVLGKEKKDGRPVMINSTDGRSYRGTKANGYGVYDLRVPKAGSVSRIAGYGTPPGVAVK